jgi:DNA repair exonuclease SbcCD nuclease subunit
VERRTLRVLLLADTHLGFDDPARPRVVRRRRGPDFFARYEDALRPAMRGQVDLVVHGGDVLYRARVPAGLVQRAFEPLKRVADRGVPVFVVPGNHERSRIPFALLAHHPRIHVFEVPRTFRVVAAGLRVAVAGFPFARVVDESTFPRLVAATAWSAEPADVRLLCMYQAVEGAVVGVHEFTFRRGRDVVPGRTIPRGLAAVLSGHIHRAQVLDHDLQGRPLAAPVVYPGSVERTSFAERLERKGHALLRFRGDDHGGRLVERRFVPLAARPMRVIEVDAVGRGGAEIEQVLRTRLAELPIDAVVRVAVVGRPGASAERVLCASGLRAIAPATMNIDLARPARERRGEAAHAAR